MRVFVVLPHVVETVVLETFISLGGLNELVKPGEPVIGGDPEK
jgi:hypothetical protein